MLPVLGMSPEESFLLFVVTPLLAGLACLVPLSMRLKRTAEIRHRKEFEPAVEDKFRAGQAPLGKARSPGTERAPGHSSLDHR
jgi:hypothetical protein